MRLFVGFGALVSACSLAAALLCAAGCNGNRASSNASPTPLSTPVMELVTHRPAWPSYRAIDFQKPGEPQLTPAQAALIRKTLAVVKPCQRRLLRYAFPEDFKMVLFFEGSQHVLWQRDLYYFPDEGTAHAIPYDNEPTPDFSIQADIANTPCR